MKIVSYAQRRIQLVSMCNITCVLGSFDKMQLSNDGAAPFLQESNLLYLTGIDEPGWTLLVDTAGISTLIAPGISDIHHVFEGGMTIKQAQACSGVDEVVTQSEGRKLLNALASKRVGVIGADPHERYNTFAQNPAPQRLRDTLLSLGCELEDVRPQLAEIRALKTEKELSIMRKAVALTCNAFAHAKRDLVNLQSEYNLDALFSFEFRNKNATHAYEPIVAGGANACTLHYAKNSARLPKNGLVLIDIGARVNGYAADITRTYAVGTPSEREVAIHAAVETAHQRIIELIKPNVLLRDYSKQVDEIMKDALQQVGLLVNRDDTETYRKYFPHAISHGLGLDVHESLGGYDSFKPGMVLTVEPGIYIPEEGIGVRIEDDILVTEQGNENLSGSLSTAL